MAQPRVRALQRRSVPCRRVPAGFDELVDSDKGIIILFSVGSSKLLRNTKKASYLPRFRLWMPVLDERRTKADRFYLVSAKFQLPVTSSSPPPPSLTPASVL